jgi:hypothetical protein
MRPATRRTWAAGAAGLALVALLLPSLAAAQPAPAGEITRVSSSSPGFAAFVLWNGQSTVGATSPSSALSANFGTVATAFYEWNWTGAGSSPPFSVAHLRLTVLYFGQPAWTKDQAFQPAMSARQGQFNVTSDLTEVRYILQGVYEVEASIVSFSGATVWSEDFYLKTAAPYDLTIATVALAAIALYEIYYLVTIGPRALPRGTVKTTAEEPPPAKGGAP